jgi:hypothetical protein
VDTGVSPGGFTFLVYPIFLNTKYFKKSKNISLGLFSTGASSFSEIFFFYIRISVILNQYSYCILMD